MFGTTTSKVMFAERSPWINQEQRSCAAPRDFPRHRPQSAAISNLPGDQSTLPLRVSRLPDAHTPGQANGRAYRPIRSIAARHLASLLVDGSFLCGR